MADFEQYTLPIEEVQSEINIVPAPNGSMLTDGSFQSPNYVPKYRGWKVDSEGNAEFQNIEITSGKVVGENAITLATDSILTIQQALDKLHSLGGGTLYLQDGTFSVTTALTGYSSVSIVGISPSATIINFGSTAANLSYTGSSVYTTGTITSIASGVTVTGSGTSWLANASAGQYLFIGTRHYKIAAVTGDTTLILSEGYTDNVTFPGAAYRICSPIVDVLLKNFYVTGSTGTGIVFTDAVQIELNNVLSNLNNKGFVFTNVSRLGMDRTLAASNTSNGYEFINVGQGDWESTTASANGGHNFVFNNLKTISGLMSGVSATSDGFNMTDCDDLTLLVEASGNGGQGVEMVSGCDDNSIDGIFNSNTSDGVKLTATSDRNRITGTYKSNGGYGINIAAATCDDNTIIVPTYSGNSSGTLNDSGTGTNNVASVPTTAYTNGTTTKNLADADTTQTIAHGLSDTPKKIRLSALGPATGDNGDVPAIALFTYNGTTGSGISSGDNNATYRSSIGTTFIIHGPETNALITGTVTFDSTNISIAWVKTNSPTGTANMMWEAEG